MSQIIERQEIKFINNNGVGEYRVLVELVSRRTLIPFSGRDTPGAC